MTIFSRQTLDELVQSAINDMGLSPDGEWLWSYYFIDVDREKLVAAGRALELEGYHFAEIFAGENSDGSIAAYPDGTVTLYLQMDKVEHHSLDSLLARNQQLHDFAKRWGLADFDGLDIGKVAT